jgi:hypothetical protein
MNQINQINKTNQINEIDLTARQWQGAIAPRLVLNHTPYAISHMLLSPPPAQPHLFDEPCPMQQNVHHCDAPVMHGGVAP